MNAAELAEANGFAQQILTALQGSIMGGQGQASAALSWACGTASANAEAALQSGAFWADCANCFEAARKATATYAAMDAIRSLATSFSPVTQAAIAVKNFAIRMALAEEAQILAATTFTNKGAVDQVLETISAAFEEAECVAADNLDNVAYVALIKMRGAVVNDLATRALQLPKLVSYTFSRAFPALWLAQRIYQDPTRAQELIAENMPYNPVFMPLTIAALSS